MPPRKPKRVREQVVAYLDARDRSLLEELVKKTGLSRTELLRQGLWKLGSERLTGNTRPGSAIDWLIENAVDDDVPPDLSERHDYYMYGGGFDKWFAARKKKGKKKRARTG